MRLQNEPAGGDGGRGARGDPGTGGSPGAGRARWECRDDRGGLDEIDIRAMMRLLHLHDRWDEQGCWRCFACSESRDGGGMENALITGPERQPEMELGEGFRIVDETGVGPAFKMGWGIRFDEARKFPGWDELLVLGLKSCCASRRGVFT